MSTFEEGRINSNLPSDFLDFIHELNVNRVEYVLVGGYAVGIHGHSRATVDIDFFYRPSPENVARLCAALRAFGAPGDIIDPDDLAKPDTVSAFGRAPMRVDLLSSISGVPFDDAWTNAVKLQIESETVPVIALAQLLANKRASGRAKDLSDLAELSKAKP